MREIAVITTALEVEVRVVLVLEEDVEVEVGVEVEVEVVEVVVGGSLRDVVLLLEEGGGWVVERVELVELDSEVDDSPPLGVVLESWLRKEILRGGSRARRSKSATASAILFFMDGSFLLCMRIPIPDPPGPAF